MSPPLENVCTVMFGGLAHSNERSDCLQQYKTNLIARNNTTRSSLSSLVV